MNSLFRLAGDSGLPVALAASRNHSIDTIENESRRAFLLGVRHGRAGAGHRRLAVQGAG